ncbi:ABC transporter ATP-binding protein [Bradyrhizobium sp. SK17]|uniref:ABC transporter ATP-binding protein n=1 Tax=Bradyrhizobium sp. SK17 TaxID=2057741 RepID=UPI000C314254|nr:ABC transporter ATP-binding protein [Bradyrhizobium sp. SK17]AUC95545.1 ABC transporter ATP-binding protein [Bradyrhizobium sp. SK17]
MLEVKDLDVFYDQSQVLRGVSLRVEPGEIVCLIGRNGVGKSTTMKAIVGLVQARGGVISFKGQNVLGLPAYRVARAGVGYVPEDRRVFGELTVLQNLRVAMRPSRSTRPWTLSDIYEIFPVLEQRRGQLAGNLSGGEKQMLTTARTLLGNPDLVLIDEPNEGLAPMYVQRVNAMIQEVHNRGTAVLLVEQSLASVKALAHRAYVMSKGEIVYQGGARELLSDPAVRQRYLEL